MKTICSDRALQSSEDEYLFSPYAALSELRLGDTAFAQTLI